MEARGEGKVLDQFSNPDNPRAHYEGTGPEIWRDTAGSITHFVSAMGTTGTIMGTSRYLKEQNPAVEIVGVTPPKARRSRGFAAGLQPTCPRSLMQPASTAPSRLTSSMRNAPRWIWLPRKVSLQVFPPAVQWLLRYMLSRQVEHAVIVAIICDRGDRYLSTGVFPA